MKELPRFRLVALAACCAVVVASCGQNAADKSSATKSQIVARVGDQVVTTQELDTEMRQANIAPDKQKDPDVVKQVLGELVVRKYNVSRANASKLDREPSILLELLRARDQVLERAILARAVSSKSLSQSDVERFVAANPAKFANRRLFRIDQVGFAFGPNSQQFVDANKQATSLEDIIEQLKVAGVPYGRQAGVLNSAEMPTELYNVVDVRKGDDVFFVRSGQNGIFFKVTGEDRRPLQGEEAGNLARQQLRADLLKAEVGLANYSAHLEAKYEGDYAKIMQGVGDKKN